MSFACRSLVVAVALNVAALTFAKEVTLTFTPSNSHTPGSLMVHVGASVYPVPVPAMAPAVLKRDMVRDVLRANGHTVTDGPGAAACTVYKVKPGTKVKVETINTMEAADSIVVPDVTVSSAIFTGTFDPFQTVGQPAIFTAGIVTDVGELTAQVSAQELNFQTDGPIICQALFQRLAPRAPQYGAQINYAGDRLEVYFDPAYTVSPGGIIFGTTSPTPGCAGEVQGGPERRRIDLRVDLPSNPAPEPVMIEIFPLTISSIIAPGSSAEQKRDTIRTSVQSHGLGAANGATPESVLIAGIDPKQSVTVSTGGTGEEADSLRGIWVNSGSTGFSGFFDPFDRVGLPAVFTAGIVTDVGELTEQVSAQELNFQTDGPIICQALFQRLAPRAPQYGAQINYAGDRLEVYFDPAYTVTQGGIIFGTTSPSPGCTGTVSPQGAPAPEAPKPVQSMRRP